MNKGAISIAALVLIVTIAGYSVYRNVSGQEAVATTATAEQPAIDAREQIVVEGKVVPTRSVALSTLSAGVVVDVLVQEGQQVQQGQLLAQIENRRARASVSQAEADLAQAKAQLEQLRAGATPTELAGMEAQLRQAEAQLRQTKGGVTAADLRAAEATLAQAKATLTKLLGGPKAFDIRDANARLEQARLTLQSQRDQLSLAKTNTRLQLDQAVASLTQAQSVYTTAQQNWQFVQDTGTDPEISPFTGAHERVDDVRRQFYFDQFVQAEAALRSAESSVEQAHVAYDNARQAEITGIQLAEEQVKTAQIALDRLLAGADRDQIATAQASVANAQAQLDKLRGEQRSGTIEVANAGVEVAAANLEKIRSGPTTSELAIAQARVQHAEAALQLAQVALAETELRAPFTGVVALLALQAGEYVTPNTPVIRLADLTAWKIETTDLSELRIASIREGSPATITFDSLPNLTLPGKVTHIRMYGENKQGDITYTVTIAPDRHEPGLRWNMTAIVRFQLTN